MTLTAKARKKYPKLTAKERNTLDTLSFTLAVSAYRNRTGIPNKEAKAIVGFDAVTQFGYKLKSRAKPHKCEGVIWEGISPHTGEQIVAIATDATGNPKTGDMVQIWILLVGMEPHVAVREGKDSGVCGSCPLRSGNGCYIRPYEAALSIYRKYKRGGYAPFDYKRLHGRKVRFGAYGDPAMIPAKFIRKIRRLADGTTGYTHQWLQPYAAEVRGLIMASVDSPEGEKKARALGWGTFRVGDTQGTDRGRTKVCPSFKGVNCAECLACDGGKRSIYIVSHGATAKRVPAEKRRLAVLNNAGLSA